MIPLDYDAFLTIISINEEQLIKQIEAGFLPTDFCNVVKNMYANICLHFIQNKEVFSYERQTAVKGIINSLLNG